MSSVRTGGRGAAETEFGYPEHLLVWTWRRIATGRAGCPLIAAEFTDACGDDAGEVFATFCTFLRALAHSGRGGLRVGPPGCRAITADERRLLTLIAAAQTNERTLFAAHLCWLARAEHREALALAARALAAAFAANHLLLASPTAVPTMSCALDAAE